MRFAVTLFFGGLLPWMAAGQTVQTTVPEATAELSDPAAASRLRDLLRNGSSQEIQRVQSELAWQLQSAQTPIEIRRASLTLSAAPTDQAVLILVGRLQQPGPEALTCALCDGLGRLLQGRLPVSESARQAAAQVLGPIAAAPDSHSRVVESAMLAIAAMRGSGLDLLLDVRQRRATPADGFFTCLAATRDPRALVELRKALGGGALPEGRRIEIIHAIGQLFASARQEALPIDAAEQAACLSLVLSEWSNTASSDQLQSVALRTLSQMAPQDRYVRSAVRAGLLAGSEERRERALEAIYLDETAPDPETVRIVEALAISDERPDFRELARAILCRAHAEACLNVE